MRPVILYWTDCPAQVLRGWPSLHPQHGSLHRQHRHRRAHTRSDDAAFTPATRIGPRTTTDLTCGQRDRLPGRRAELRVRSVLRQPAEQQRCFGARRGAGREHHSVDRRHRPSGQRAVLVALPGIRRGRTRSMDGHGDLLCRPRQLATPPRRPRRAAARVDPARAHARARMAADDGPGHGWRNRGLPPPSFKGPGVHQQPRGRRDDRHRRRADRAAMDRVHAAVVLRRQRQPDREHELLLAHARERPVGLVVGLVHERDLVHLRHAATHDRRDGAAAGRLV